jgi:dipeptide/tripeptide permease
MREHLLLQFEESQQKERAQFFSFFYFAINAGSLVAIMLTPILRGRVQCFDSQYCFPLAFGIRNSALLLRTHPDSGVPGLLMLTALILFLCGWKFYKKAPAAKGNVVFSVFGCICLATKEKINAVFKYEYPCFKV